MNGTRNRRLAFYVEATGPNEKAFHRGLTWLGEMRDQQNAGMVLLAIPQLSNLNGVIESVIGEAAVKVLKKEKRVALSSTARLELLTEQDRRYEFRGPILAVYPTQKLLDKLDALTGVTAICVVPWTMEESQPWIKTWEAERLALPGEPVVASEPTSGFTLDPVLHAALTELTDAVNLSTGISHQSDKAKAVMLFRLLRDANISFDPEAVKGWLLSAGKWTPSGANAVRQVASDIASGKRPQSVKIAGQPAYGKVNLRRWQAQAAENSSRENVQEDSGKAGL